MLTVLTAQFMLSMDLLIVVVALLRIIPSAISGLTIPRRYSHGVRMALSFVQTSCPTHPQH